MRSAWLPTLILSGLLFAPVAYAQSTSVTATCKDGTDFSGTSRSGACRGHKGVASWTTAATAGAGSSPGIAPAAEPPVRAAAATPAAPPPSVPGRTNATSGAVSSTAKTGGPGQVWVNNASKVYHCPGDRYYGKTKSGEFMSLSAAQAAGDRPSDGKACTS